MGAAKFKQLLLFLLILIACLSASDGGDIPGEPDSMPGWLGASYRAPITKLRKDAHDVPSLDYKRIIQLSAWKPRAYLYKGFLSDEECEHIKSLAMPRLERSEVADESGGGGGSVSDVRTSFGMFIEKAEDDVVRAIEKRIEQWTFLPVAHQESLQVLRYTRGQKYEAHHDYFYEPQSTQQGGHRYATVLMYLNDVKKGGETAFTNVPDPTPKDDSWSDCAKGVLAVKPRKGDALLFFSMLPDGSPDENSLHYACPVIEGVKWSAPKWIHVRDFDSIVEVPNDPSSCSDTNGLCPTWAASGECEKNPHFMIGGKGTHGACRKSCGACKVAVDAKVTSEDGADDA